MIVQLIRYGFPDRPDWEIMSERVPIGTKYEVLGYDSGGAIYNIETREIRSSDFYLLTGNGDTGWLPTVCFEVVPEES